MIAEIMALVFEHLYLNYSKCWFQERRKYSNLLNTATLTENCCFNNGVTEKRVVAVVKKHCNKPKN